jgi:hypothetical protein
MSKMNQTFLNTHNDGLSLVSFGGGGGGGGGYNR